MSTRERILHGLTSSDFARRIYRACLSVPVFGAGLRKIVRTLMPVGTRLWIRVPRGRGKGLWMYADPRYELGYTNGDHEPWVQDLLSYELRPGDCYYDVGAHSGFFCLIAAQLVESSGAVLALEPDPRNASLLKANIARNNLGQVAILEAAAWSNAGQVAFELPPEASNRTQGHVSFLEKLEAHYISVAAVCLDDVVFSERRRPPDLLKMDVEGAEWEVLQGAERLLRECGPRLICEVHEATQMQPIRDYLQGLGYKTEEWKPVHPHYSDYRQLYIWAVPRERTTCGSSF